MLVIGGRVMKVCMEDVAWDLVPREWNSSEIGVVEWVKRNMLRWKIRKVKSWWRKFMWVKLRVLGWEEDQLEDGRIGWRSTLMKEFVIGRGGGSSVLTIPYVFDKICVTYHETKRHSWKMWFSFGWAYYPLDLSLMIKWQLKRWKDTSFY